MIRNTPTLTQPPDPHPRTPRLRLPPGAWDCHFHLFGPADRYRWDPASHYISADALPETLIALHTTLGIERGVIVSGGAYGCDYSLLADALARFGPRLRGVILPPADLSSKEILRLHALGVRGVRFVSERRKGSLPGLDESIAKRVFDTAGWQVHYYADGDLETIAPRLLALPNAIVLDHFAGVRSAQGIDQPAFGRLLRMLDTGRVWVKLSGPMRCDAGSFPYAGVTPAARALVAHAPERLIWGSDWPHVNMDGRAMPNDGDLVDLIGEWIPDAQRRAQVLTANPAQLFA